jgi:hypothetical protein
MLKTTGKKAEKNISLFKAPLEKCNFREYYFIEKIFKGWKFYVEKYKKEKEQVSTSQVEKVNN